MHALFLGKLVVTVSRYNLKYFELYRDARHQGWKGKALGLLWAMLKWVTCNTGVSRSYVAATMGMATSTRGIHCWPQRKHPVPRRGATSLLLPYPANKYELPAQPKATSPEGDVLKVSNRKLHIPTMQVPAHLPTLQCTVSRVRMSYSTNRAWWPPTPEVSSSKLNLQLKKKVHQGHNSQYSHKYSRSDGLRSTLTQSKFQNFHEGACPQTPLQDCACSIYLVSLSGFWVTYASDECAKAGERG